ncbi:MAG: hypothetical protein JOZ32_07285 [Bryobacterales bacterium]|nr:hypothetical protein [Bryobacterales bacterium]
MYPVEPRFPGVEDPPVEVRHPWYHKLGIFLFIIVCFEVGAFLMVFPWTPQWDNNSVANVLPWLRGIWRTSYFRGALSGVGLLNIYISLGEVARLRRPGGSRPRADRLPPADKLKTSTL